MSDETKQVLAPVGLMPQTLFQVPGLSSALPVQAPMMMWAGAFTAVYVACGVAIAMMYAGNQASRF